jgi:WD40 repeat protein
MNLHNPDTQPAYLVWEKRALGAMFLALGVVGVTLLLFIVVPLLMVFIFPIFVLPFVILSALALIFSIIAIKKGAPKKVATFPFILNLPSLLALIALVIAFIYAMIDAALNPDQIRIQGTTYAGDIEFSPDGAMLAATFYDRNQLSGFIPLLDAQSGQQIKKIEGYAAMLLSFSPDGSQLAVSSWDDVVHLFDSDSGEEIYSLPNYNIAHFLSDGNTLLLLNRVRGITNQIAWFNTTSRQEITSTPFEARVITDLSPDRSILAVVDGNLLTILSTTDLTQARNPIQFDIRLDDAAFSPDNQLVAVTDSSKIQIWDIRKRETIHAIALDFVPSPGSGITTDLEFSPDGKTLAYTMNQELILIDMQTFETKARIDFSETALFPVSNLVFSPDSSQIAISITHALVMVDAQTGAILWQFSP